MTTDTIGKIAQDGPEGMLRRPFFSLLRRKKTSSANVWSHNVGLAPSLLLFLVRSKSRS